MKMTQYLKWKADPSKGEVFTPISLVSEMLDKIPDEVWKNPDAKFLDPCMGKGTFLIEIVRRLTYIYGYTEIDAKSRVYGYDIRVKYINHLQRRGFVNVRHKDFLNEEISMKFDVIVGNPPYQIKVGPRKTEPIWDKFANKCFSLLKEGGYISLIHPSGWRNVEGRFKETQRLFLSNKMIYLRMNNEKRGMEIFGAETRFDYYLIQKTPNDSYKTKVIFQDEVTKEMFLNDMEFIPSGNMELLDKLLAKTEEQTVEVVHSYSNYETRKSWMSKVQNEEFIHPVIYTIDYQSQPSFYYSSTNQNGHFGKSKVIWSNGRISSVGSLIDSEGQYGLTQFAYAIVDKPENLQNIKRALDSKKFKHFMELCAVGQLTINHKIIGKFKKDFWKEFIDE